MPPKPTPKPKVGTKKPTTQSKKKPMPMKKKAAKKPTGRAKSNMPHRRLADGGDTTRAPKRSQTRGRKSNHKVLMNPEMLMTSSHTSLVDRLKASPTTERLKAATQQRHISDRNHSRTARQNSIYFRAMRGKPSFQNIRNGGGVMTVDPFKQFHKHFNPYDLTSGKARRTHLKHRPFYKSVRLNELDVGVRSAAEHPTTRGTFGGGRTTSFR